MIVDDDAHIRERLKRNIPFEKYNLTLVCEAFDGEDALEKQELEKPDIIILDINIPYINGIEVASKIKSMHNDVMIIMITCYNDFDYAQAAIKAGVLDIIAKPIDTNELNLALEKAISRIMEIRSSYQNQKQLELLVQDNISELQKLFVRNLLTDNLQMNDVTIISRLSSLQIEMNGNNYIVAVVVPILSDISQ